jgi:hypothetical protein
LQSQDPFLRDQRDQTYGTQGLQQAAQGLEEP